jgi:hypothetical protein
MTLKNASRETLLNWLVRSKRTAAREGRMPVDWRREINFSTCCICIVIALMIRFVLFGVPTAYLKGSM